MAATTKTLKEPKYVFRPPPRVEAVEAVYARRKKSSVPVNLLDELLVMLPVFKLLTTSELARAARSDSEIGIIHS